MKKRFWYTRRSDHAWSEALRVSIAAGMALARVKETSAGTEVSSVHTDHLGSPVAATGASGALLWRDNRTPFGEPWGPQDPANDNSPGFTGHIEDSATGLTYMQARYYDPALARFLSNDPVSFTGNRPVMAALR